MKVALTSFALLAALALPAVAAYNPEAELYRSTSDLGTGVTLNSSGTANNGSGSGDWWFTGPFMYVGSGYNNMAGFGVIEDHSGFLGGYWKRTCLMKISGGSVSRVYPPYNPDSNNSVNTYRVWVDPGASVFRYSFNGASNNETISGLSTAVFEHDAGCLGGLSGGTISMPSRRFTNWQTLNGSWGIEPSGTLYQSGAGVVTWKYSQAGTWDFTHWTQ